MKRILVPALAGLSALFNVATAQELASNRAIYDVSLDHTSGGDVVAARGRMAVEFRDTCNGWSTTQRLIADMTDSSGLQSRTDFFVSAWESKDGHTMRFDISDSRDGKSNRRRGSAVLAADGTGSAELIAGKPPKFALPIATQFPTDQTLSVLRAAMAGRNSFKHIVFQGGDPTDLYFSTAEIGKSADAGMFAADHKADKYGLLKNIAAWPVLVGFYPLATKSESPDYEVATHLYANGVNGSMSLIYPRYTLRAKLSRLEALARSC